MRQPRAPNRTSAYVLRCRLSFGRATQALAKRVSPDNAQLPYRCRDRLVIACGAARSGLTMLGSGPGLGGRVRHGHGGSAFEHEAVAQIIQQVALEPLGERDPGVAQCCYRLVRQLTGQLMGAWQQALRREHLGDDVEGEGLLGGELLAGEPGGGAAV